MPRGEVVTSVTDQGLASLRLILPCLIGDGLIFELLVPIFDRFLIFSWRIWVEWAVAGVFPRLSKPDSERARLRWAMQANEPIVFRLELRSPDEFLEVAPSEIERPARVKAKFG